MKKCSKCRIEKSLDSFHNAKSNKDGRYSSCKDCCKELKRTHYIENIELEIGRSKKYYEENIETVRAYKQEYYIINKEELSASKKVAYQNNKKDIILKTKTARLKKKYNLCENDVDNMLIEQSNCCAVCHCTFSDKKRYVIDHCHKTGKVRELLCDNCNTALGMLKEDVNIIDSLKEYKIKHTAFVWKWINA